MANRVQRRHPKLLEWQLTPWKVDGKGRWKQQPVILIEGEIPFYADNPQPYIDKLEAMSKDASLIKGSFYTFIGQFKDAFEQRWYVKR